MRAVLFSFVLTAGAWAQIPREDLFSQARGKILENRANQPNYTCLETIERTRQDPGGSQIVQDTLRLEVALVDGKELFGWVGAQAFEDRDLLEMVPTGMFGNGSYGLYIRMIFSAPGVRFESKGLVKIGGNELERFDYEVSRRASGYTIRVGERQAVVGFHGSLFIDPANANLLRLEVVADDIPAELELTAAEDKIDYARMRIGYEEFLLPKESALLMAGKDVESRNRTQFSGCRKFQGESQLIFDDPELDVPETIVAIEEVQLPVDLLLSLEVRSDVNPKTAAVGDAVEAVLRSDVKRGKEKLVAKGATAKGRIVELARTNGYVVVTIQFAELEWRGGHAKMKARFEKREGINAVMRRGLISDPGTFALPEPLPRSLKGEVLSYRTVR